MRRCLSGNLSHIRVQTVGSYIEAAGPYDGPAFGVDAHLGELGRVVDPAPVQPEGVAAARAASDAIVSMRGSLSLEDA
jgi:hypothetical protein